MECRSLLAIAWILILTLTLCEGQFVVDRNRVRTTPSPGATTIKVIGKVWDGVGPKPQVPGKPEEFRPEDVVRTHGGACKIDPLLKDLRGTYFDRDTDVRASFYPWAAYVGNCDVSKFLYCQTGINTCKCFPGYYWNETVPGVGPSLRAGLSVPAGSCVAGFGQNCSTFIGYDFRITPICGDGMQCDPERDDFSKCVCFKKVASLVYPGLHEGVQEDGFGNDKHFCAKRVPRNVTNTCYEYRAKEWKGSPGAYTLTDVTRTDCNDLPGDNALTNVYCKFPASQTGTPSPARNFTYGARTNGTCTCTDSKLKWSPRLGGCYPPAESACEGPYANGTIKFKGWDAVNKTTKPEVQANCGINAMCRGLTRLRNGTYTGNGTCQCTTHNVTGELYLLDKDGFCSPNVTELNAGLDKNVGDNCTVKGDGVGPCWRRDNQECVNHKCQCKKGYAETLVADPDLSKSVSRRLCRGLYGIKCMGDEASLAQCLPNSGLTCKKVDELKLINPNVNPEQQYCVCDVGEFNYLNTQTGKCGAMALTPTHFGLILLLLLYLGVYFDSPGSDY